MYIGIDSLYTSIDGVNFISYGMYRYSMTCKHNWAEIVNDAHSDYFHKTHYAKRKTTVEWEKRYNKKGERKQIKLWLCEQQFLICLKCGNIKKGKFTSEEAIR